MHPDLYPPKDLYPEDPSVYEGYSELSLTKVLWDEIALPIFKVVALAGATLVLGLVMCYFLLIAISWVM